MTRQLFQHGVKRHYVFLRDQIIERLERREGIATMGTLHPEELGISSPYSVRYEPSGWLALRRILPPRQVSVDDVFIDYGSGMGRVVYQAATRYPFKRVIGVELSEQLNEIARANIERNRERLRCPDVTLVAADALDYDFPDDVTIVFFANPFKGPVFAGVLAKIEESLARNPRRLRVAYLNPVEEKQLLEAGFRMTRRVRGLRPTPEWSKSNSISLYERRA